MFAEHVAPRISDHPRIVDLGCGPGLLIRDLSNRVSSSELFGCDVTQAMIDYANDLRIGATFEVLDLTTSPVPLPEHSVDMLSMAAVLHVLDEPLKFLAEIKRLLKPGGTFLLVDWVQQPLEKYMAMMMENVPAERVEQMEQAMLRLSVAHNKYTVDDWIWLLGKGGFEVNHCAQTHSEHFRTFVCRTP